MPETAAAFGAGEITREHAIAIVARYTPERAPMIEHIETELVAFARLSTPKELQGAVKTMTDAYDGDTGARSDAAEYELNTMTLSPSLYGRGVLNGSFDTEVTDIALTALDAEMEVLRRPQDPRRPPQRRAEAFESICRQYLASRGTTTARGRGQTQVSVVWDISSIDLTNPEVAALARADTAHGGRLSRSTLERLTCDCNLSRVITDGPSAVLDVGRITRTIPAPLWNAARRPRPALSRTRLRTSARRMRSASHLALGERRPHQPRKPQTPVLAMPPTTTHPRRPSPRRITAKSRRDGQPRAVPRAFTHEVAAHSSIRDGEEAPGSGHTLQFVIATVFELDTGTGDEIDDCSRREHFTRRGQTGDPRRDVNADTGHVLVV